MRSRLTFKRPCKNCGKMFRPSGKFGRFCDKCRYEANKNRVWGKRK